MDAEADDDRAPDFLRKDFIHRVRRSDVRYILQAQLRDTPPPPVGNQLSEKREQLASSKASA
ncbi:MULTISPECIES: hypothetical protein [Sinorhizobium]|uniref:hypothetical protein n=1 Tax=Sinorhizobium TaxID=28105 RepID=UPI0004B53908|nr:MULTISPECIES: hypothetical protein [Sinorhizobium]ASY60718.1 hypothetical protein SS05631_a43340 [Sinorhizobium sp. CCBAU 05631]ASY74110.1 hypothetical protein SF83666_a45230 [Sinorhizobium fredii CCBAU 83666]